MYARPLVAGFATLLLVGALVLGAIFLSQAEASAPPTPVVATSVPTSAPTLAPTVIVILPAPTTAATPAHLLVAPTHTIQTPCPAPAGWQSYTTLPGDTFELLASVLQIRTSILRQANCLETGEPAVGAQIYLPPQPVSTKSSTPGTN